MIKELILSFELLLLLLLSFCRIFLLVLRFIIMLISSLLIIIWGNSWFMRFRRSSRFQLIHCKVFSLIKHSCFSCFWLAIISSRLFWSTIPLPSTISCAIYEHILDWSFWSTNFKTASIRHTSLFFKLFDNFRECELLFRMSTSSIAIVSWWGCFFWGLTLIIFMTIFSVDKIEMVIIIITT